MCCNCSGNNYNGNFTYIAYASDVSGANFSTIRNTVGVNRNFMSIYVSKTELDANSVQFPNYFQGRYFFMGSIDTFLDLQKFMKERTSLVSGNIAGSIVSIQVSSIIDPIYKPDVFLNGVYIDINTITFNQNMIQINLSSLNIEPVVGDNVNVKYIKK